jgi:hypothetical protein
VWEVGGGGTCHPPYLLRKRIKKERIIGKDTREIGAGLRARQSTIHIYNDQKQSQHCFYKDPVPDSIQGLLI